MTLAASSASRRLLKFNTEQHDQRDRQRHGHAQARRRLLQIAEFPTIRDDSPPAQHGGIDRVLGLEHRTAKIAAAHAELEGT